LKSLAIGWWLLANEVPVQCMMGGAGALGGCRPWFYDTQSGGKMGIEVPSGKQTLSLKSTR